MLNAFSLNSLVYDFLLGRVCLGFLFSTSSSSPSVVEYDGRSRELTLRGCRAVDLALGPVRADLGWVVPVDVGIIISTSRSRLEQSGRLYLFPFPLVIIFLLISAIRVASLSCSNVAWRLRYRELCRVA